MVLNRARVLSEDNAQEATVSQTSEMLEMTIKNH